MIIKVPKQWQPIPGRIYGLQQSCLTGKVELNVDSDYDFHELDKHMLEYIPIPAPSHNDTSNEYKLACRIAHWVIELQRQQQLTVSPLYAVIFLTEKKNYKQLLLALPYHQWDTFNITLNWVLVAIKDFHTKSPSQGHNYPRFNKVVEYLKSKASPGKNRFFLFNAALNLDIPIDILSNRIYKLGTGAYSRWLNSSVSDKTSPIGLYIAKHKNLTAKTLNEIGLPVPMQSLVYDEKQAINLANIFQYPVVIKPENLDQGLGVYADIRNDKDLIDAYKNAKQLTPNILIEKFVKGNSYRLTIYDQQLLSVTMKRPWGIDGDGLHSIEELIGIKNHKEDLRGFTSPELDQEAQGLLAQNGYSMNTIPEEGIFIPLRRKSNTSAGGSVHLVPLDKVHPDNQNMVLRAAKVLNLDWVGIDLIIENISKSWMEIGGAICDVNGQPQMGEIIVYKMMTQMMKEGCRIPMHLIIQNEQHNSLSQVKNDLLDKSKEYTQWKNIGISTIDGIWINDNNISSTKKNTFQAASALLRNNDVEFAVCVMSLNDIGTYGLPADEVDKMIIMDYSNWQTSYKQQLTLLLDRIDVHIREISYQ